MHIEVLLVNLSVRYVLLNMWFIHCKIFLLCSCPFGTILLWERSLSGQYYLHGGSACCSLCQNKQGSCPKRSRCHSIIQTNTTQKHTGHMCKQPFQKRRCRNACISFASTLLYATSSSSFSRDSWEANHCWARIKTDSATAWHISHLTCLQKCISMRCSKDKQRFPNEPPNWSVLKSWIWFVLCCSGMAVCFDKIQLKEPKQIVVELWGCYTTSLFVFLKMDINFTCF